jgi:hypothetical protein
VCIVGVLFHLIDSPIWLSRIHSHAPSDNTVNEGNIFLLCGFQESPERGTNIYRLLGEFCFEDSFEREIDIRQLLKESDARFQAGSNSRIEV